jgi:hypothetical protein
VACIPYAFDLLLFATPRLRAALSISIRIPLQSRFQVRETIPVCRARYVRQHEISREDARSCASNVTCGFEIDDNGAPAI